MSKDDTITIHAQGLGGGNAVMIWPGRSRCGDIKHGVVMEVLNNRLRGGFVIAFDDLERAYLAAKAAREGAPPNA
jgi:hypothetical protein